MIESSKPTCGLVLFRTSRFEGIGEGTGEGPYEARLDRQLEELIERLSPDLGIVYPGMVASKADVIEAIKMIVNQEVDCVITGFMSWAEDAGWMRLLRDMPDVPTLFYLSAWGENRYENDPSSDFLARFVSGSQLVGALQGSVSIRRMGRSLKVVVDDGSQEALKRITAFARAARARAALRGATIGLLQSFNEVMWSTYVDPRRFFAQVGPELTFISFDALKRAIDGVSEERVEAYTARLKGQYRVMDRVDEEKLVESARASLGIASLARSEGLDAVVVNDLDLSLHRKVGLRPGLYPPDFHKRSAILAPEGDVGAAALMLALRVMTGKHVNFVEPFYLDTADNTFTAGHHGVTDHTDERFEEHVIISPDVRYEDQPFKYAGAPFAWYRYPPGVHTLAHFSECSGHYRIVSCVATSLPGEHILPGYSHGVFRVEGEVGKLFEEILSVGTTQHFVAVAGDVRGELDELAQVGGFQHIRV